jgi:hypothetical protein
LNDPTAGSLYTHVWIPIGAALFVIALGVSALVVPQLRLLHFLQALIYVAVVFLARRNSVWGFGAAITIATAWNSLNLFVTHLSEAGAMAFWSLLRSGQVQRLDTMMVALGTLAHFILIVACLAALFELRAESGKWWKFAGGGLAVLAYFALIIAIARPR